MIRSFFFLFLTMLFACDTAQNIKNPTQSYFLKYFGDEGNQTARDLIVNSDGTFYILGNSTQTSSSNTKVYIAHVDALGNVIKQITYGALSMDAKDFEIAGGNLVIVANRQSMAKDVLLSRYTLGLDVVDSVALSAGPSSFANSLTALSDGGFIIEGYQGDTSVQSTEMHLRVSSTLTDYATTVTTGWGNTNSIGTIAVGVKTIQQNPNTFYMFGYTNANYSGLSGTINKRFWTYPIPYNGSGVGNSDDPSFLSAGGADDKILTDAIKVKVGGYLLVGISNSGTDGNLKASITSSTDTAFNFQPTGVFQDKILLTNLGQGSPYATAFSSTSYNFILVNTYKTSSSKSDILLMKVDNALVPQWGNPVQFGGSGEDTAAAVAELPDGHIMVLGTMQLGNPPEQKKIVLMKLNANGQLSD